MCAVTAEFIVLQIDLAPVREGGFGRRAVVRKGTGALSLDVSGGDRETRNLVLWLCFSAAAAAIVCCFAALALMSGSGAPRATTAVIPPLGSAPPLSAPVATTSAESAPAPAPDTSAPNLVQEPEVEAPPKTVPPGAKRDVARLEIAPPPPRLFAPLPPARPGGANVGDTFAHAAAHSPLTAVYDISAHIVYLPDGTRLEAHSGLGLLLDDPRSVTEVDRGATPPHLYELTPREEIFHGVQALRLNPIGEGEMFGRNGLLAHSYMLGPRGDSNGCVSFKNYDAFLKAYQNGQVKRLAVVARLN